MAYSEVWDETQPLDTSLAALIGQDIRNFKTDVRQRIASFCAGTLANRPTPEAVWGTANIGVMYFATDTNQVFQWTGSAWIDITASIGSWSGLLYANGSTTNTPGNGAVLQVLYTIPVGVPVPAGHGFRFKAIILAPSTVAQTNYTFSIGTTPSTGAAIAANAVTNNFVIQFSGEIVNRAGVQNSQALVPNPCFRVGVNNQITNFCDSFGDVSSNDWTVSNLNAYLSVNSFAGIPSSDHLLVESFLVERI